MPETTRRNRIKAPKIQVSVVENLESNIESIYFIKISRTRIVLYYLLYFLIPFFFLVFELLSDFWVYGKIMYRVKCTEPDATHVLIHYINNQKGHAVIERKKLFFDGAEEIIWTTFTNQYIRYIYLKELQEFTTVNDYFVKNMRMRTFIKRYKAGRYNRNISELLDTFGTNKLEIRITSYASLLWTTLKSPLGIYQIFAWVIIFMAGALVYSYTSIGIYIIFTIKSVIERRRIEEKLAKLTNNATSNAIIIRRNDDNSFSKTVVKFEEIVPGDLIEITQNMVLSADMILVAGNCIMDESLLTGENEPKIKNPVTPKSEDTPLDDIEPQHFLRSGSKCIYTRTSFSQVVLALVVTTGYDSVKGNLIRALLNPKRAQFKFLDDARKFVYFIVIIGICGMIYYIIIFHTVLSDVNWNPTVVFYRVMFILMGTIKPTIPLTIFAGLDYASYRLRRKNIYALNAYKISEAGLVKFICFDKTGTLTERNVVTAGYLTGGNTLAPENTTFREPDDFKKWYIRNFRAPAQYNTTENNLERRYSLKKKDSIVYIPNNINYDDDILETSKNNSLEFETDSRLYSFHKPIFATDFQNENYMRRTENYLMFIIGIGVTNNLVKINKEILGESLEVEMFKNSIFDIKYKMAKDPNSELKRYFYIKQEYETTYPELCDNHLTVKKVNEYYSKNKIMSVIISYDKRYYLFAKGAPENIEISSIQSTVPEDYYLKLYNVAKKGLRVIALAYREISKAEIENDREEIEKDMNFLGFYLFENDLKKLTKQTLSILKSKRIKNIMISGDLSFTCIAIAVRSGIIPFHYRIIICSHDYKKGGKIKYHWLENSTQEFQKEDNIDTEYEVLTWEQVLGYAGSFTIAIDASTFFKIVEDIKNDDDENRVKRHLSFLFDHISVYSRADPHQKKKIVGFIKQQSKVSSYVAYVGDGSNDTEAFRKADVALALGNFEMSVSASFVSKTENIYHTIDLLKEGRAALYNGMVNFEYIIFMQINQFLVQMILYTRYIFMNLNQSYFLDIFIFTMLSLMMNDFGPKKELSERRPKANIFNKQTMITLIILIFLTMTSIIISIVIFTHIDGYISPIDKATPEQKEAGSLDVMTQAYFDNHFLFSYLSLAYVTYFVLTNFKNTFTVSILVKPIPLIYSAIMLVCVFIIMYSASLPESVFSNWIQDFFLVPDYFKMPPLFAILFAVLILIVGIVIFFSDVIENYYIEWKKKRGAKHKQIQQFNVETH